MHIRLGCGAGHYFRALWGQDMAGLDVALWQLVPGFDTMPYAAPSGELDGEFFHYGLGKMGASLAHLDPKKDGRAMCEVFGAYGWTEGLKLMKWMTDHLLVRGINTFVPHAFSQAEFPDPDCPPHLYARAEPAVSLLRGAEPLHQPHQPPAVRRKACRFGGGTVPCRGGMVGRLDAVPAAGQSADAAPDRL